MSSSTNNNLSLQASWQIEAMCLSLQSAAQSQDSNITDALPYLVQAIAKRIMDLNAAWVNHLVDESADGEASKTLKQELFGLGGGAA